MGAKVPPEMQTQTIYQKFQPAELASRRLNANNCQECFIRPNNVLTDSVVVVHLQHLRKVSKLLLLKDKGTLFSLGLT